MKIFAHISWLYATTVIFIAIALSILLFPILPRPYPRKISNWMARYFTFYSTTVKGTEDPTAQMLLINHQSDIDVGVLETSTKKDLTWVAKKALFKVPFFGLAMSLPEDIEIERESKTSLVKLLRAVKDRVNKKRTIAMFPEGTRTKEDVVKKFKRGFIKMAREAQVGILPVVMRGSRNVLRQGSMKINPNQTVSVVIGKIFHIDQDSDSEILAKIEAFYAGKYNQLKSISD